LVNFTELPVNPHLNQKTVSSSKSLRWVIGVRSKSLQLKEEESAQKEKWIRRLRTKQLFISPG
jgi:hypothetical protein